MRQFVWHDTDSFLHRLNPLTKLALALSVAMLVTFFNEPVTPFAIAALAAVTTWRLGRVPWLTIQRPLGLGLLLGSDCSGRVWCSTPAQARMSRP